MSQELDEFHAHEALDRASVMADMVEANLLNHPYIKAHPDVFKHVSKAVSELYTAYQLIGIKHL